MLVSTFPYMYIIACLIIFMKCVAVIVIYIVQTDALIVNWVINPWMEILWWVFNSSHVEEINWNKIYGSPPAMNTCPVVMCRDLFLVVETWYKIFQNLGGKQRKLLENFQTSRYSNWCISNHHKLRAPLYVNTRAIWKVTSGELLTKQAMGKSKKIPACISYFST
jgi:hypothetical protein